MAVASDSGIQISAVMKHEATVASITPRSTSKGFSGASRRRMPRPCRNSIAIARKITARYRITFRKGAG
ncbi:hypothetical protein D3C78_1379150 [compost metagenome]